MAKPIHSLVGLAERACYKASLYVGGDGCLAFDRSCLKAKEQAAADALIFAALSCCMAARASGKKPPKAMYWEGRRWFLSAVPGGRVMVSTNSGWGGLVSLPALYEADAVEETAQ